MEALRHEFSMKGGSPEEWDFILSEGLKFGDLEWINGAVCRDSWKEVNERLGEGRTVEYHCYDARKKSQGVAVFEVAGVSDEAKHLLKGIHMVSSDGYYQWYGEHELSIENTVYHVCSCGVNACDFRLPRRDRRQLIHMDHWRVMNPGLLLSQEYSKDVGLSKIRSAVEKFVPHPHGPPGGALGGGGHPVAVEKPQGVVGAGLDEVMHQADAFPPEAPKDRDRGRPEKRERSVRRSVGSLLNERAEGHEAELVSERRKKKKRKSKVDRAERKKRSRGEPGVSTSSDDDDGSSSSGMPFQKLSTRGEKDLWRQSQSNPGKLLKGGLQEMGRYLADRVGGDPKTGWEDRKVMAYVNQIFLANHSNQSLGIRNIREAQTLGCAIDMLMAGNLGGLGDLWMQRLKALETAVAEQSWNSARHQELIAPQSASLTNQAERESAAKAEVRAAKLRATLTKNKAK